MNVPCHACGTDHQSLQARDVVKMLDAYQEGEGQIVTRQGIKTRCILETIGIPPRRNHNKKGTPSYGQPALSGVC